MKGENMSFTMFLVDDNEEDLYLLRKAINDLEQPIKVKSIGNGETLLHVLRNANIRYTNDNPTVILLDINMPGIDGIETLKRIRENNNFSCIIIVIYTSSISERDVHNAYRAGANSFISKPHSYSEILESIQKVYTYWSTASKTPSLSLP